MAPNKMLIDATHPEETRVVVLRNGRVEEFDYESAARKLLRGNIYLAKVTRVEPSLQAGFVDYGGNRHGFLAFNEIHPDYYQIPMADRQALLDEEAAAEAAEEAAADARAERLARRQPHRPTAPVSESDDEAGEGGEQAVFVEEPDEQDDDDADDESRGDEEPTAAGDEQSDRDADEPDDGEAEPESEPAPRTLAVEAEDASDRLTEDTSSGAEDSSEPDSEGAEQEATQAGAPTGEIPVPPPTAEAESVEQTGAEDALEELPSRPRRRPRSYKIQEVIKRRQIILVQVVKEERGNKGAALTTYLSLAGRYTVLMPNTARGGGISRKITNPQDRKRLKAIAAELEVPDGMGLIIRTAGAARTKQEIKRDFEYLLRLWESVRDLTLQSTAPSLVYEEGNLIKRSIRDLYNKDVEDIVVAGEHAHGDARDFMRMLMPSHAKNVVLHQDPEPLFTKFGIERQLNAMFSPYVTLKSGGYLVINQTEALVAIDVNSGKATREFSIEETALNTNLEASDEIARQLKLRDLAGLIVIDFIDMEEKRNNRAVERRLKDALRFDRARIQLGRISHFGLMEMSRQRLRSGVLEGSTSQCPHCQGTGIIRSTESVALAVLRGLEDALMAGARTSLVATTTSSVALYILNHKRQFINDMEGRHGIGIAVQASDKLQGANFTIEKGHAAPAVRRPERAAVNMDWGFESEGGEVVETEADEVAEADIVEIDGDSRGGDRGGERGEPREARGEGRDGGRRRRRRRGRRGGADRERGDEVRGPRFEDDEAGQAYAEESADGNGAGPDTEPVDAGAAADGEEPRARADETGEPREEGRRRRRGRRGGRRGRDRRNGNGDGRHSERPEFAADEEGGGREQSAEAPESAADGGDIEVDSAPEPKAASERPQRRAEPPAAAETAAADPAPTPAPRRRSEATSSEPRLERVVVKSDEAAVTAEPDAAGPARRGWWQRRLGG